MSGGEGATMVGKPKRRAAKSRTELLETGAEARSLAMAVYAAGRGLVSLTFPKRSEGGVSGSLIRSLVTPRGLALSGRPRNSLSVSRD